MFPEFPRFGRALPFGGQDLLNAHLIDEVPPAQIPQVLAFVIIGQIGPQALGHGEHQRSIAHIEPERSANEFAVGVPCERIIRFGAKIRIVEISHDMQPSLHPPFKAFLPSSREPVP